MVIDPGMHPDRSDEKTGDRVGRAVFAFAVLAFVGVAIPMLWRGAPVADDFNNCIAPRELGLGGFVAASWEQLGAIRPSRVLEILLTAGVCDSLPFGVAIAVPLVLTIIVAVLARALLRDLGVPVVWANVGGALWLLQPLGTEAGLWPAALHVPLGLALTLLALRWYHGGRLAWASVANLGAALCTEQVIFALPLAAALVARPRERRRAATISGIIAVVVATSFVLWPGSNPRLRASVIERIGALTANPTFYVAYPAVGLGLHSIPLAIRWFWPWSLPLLALAAVAGWRVGPRIAYATPLAGTRNVARLMLAVVALAVLANVVVVLAVPQQGSPRVFAPTWLAISLVAAMAAASIQWKRPRLVGVCGGLFAAGAILSLMFSVSVRLLSSDFTRRAAHVVAERVGDASRVAICDVQRTVVQPAPRGAFSVHEFVYEWAAERALQYYTGRRATIYLAGELWARPCPPVADVDAVISFNELLSAGEPVPRR